MNFRVMRVNHLSALVLSLVAVMGAGCAAQTDPGNAGDEGPSITYAQADSSSDSPTDVDPITTSQTVQSACVNVLDVTFDSGIERGKSCGQGPSSFTFTDPLEVGGPLPGDVWNESEALEICINAGAFLGIPVSPTFLKYYGGPDVNLAATCTDYAAAGQPGGLPARRWVAGWGCCADGTTAPPAAITAPVPTPVGVPVSAPF